MSVPLHSPAKLGVVLGMLVTHLGRGFGMFWFMFSSLEREGVGMAKLGSEVLGEGWEGNEKQNHAELLCQEYK